VAGGSPGWRVAGIHSRVPGLSTQVSGTGYQVQVRVRGKVQVLNLYPNLNTWTWLLAAETWDLKMLAFPGWE